jgi:hypothetical protein
MKKVIQNGILSSNALKVIACILMVIDHVGFYMGGIFPHYINYMLRFLGRLSMPVFAFLIVEGIIHTKSINRYIFRILIFACITQTLMFLMGILNVAKYPNYYVQVNEYLNILYSFFICVVAIKFIDTTKNVYLKLLMIGIVFLFYNVINIELGIRVPILVFGFYYVKKLKEKLKTVDNENRMLYIMSLMLVIIMSVMVGSENFLYDIPSILSIIIIILYNGKRGNKMTWLKYAFYCVYPVHHLIIYYIAMRMFG